MRSVKMVKDRCDPVDGTPELNYLDAGAVVFIARCDDMLN